MRNVDTTFCVLTADGGFKCTLGPTGPLAQLIQTKAFFVDGDISQAFEYIDLCNKMLDLDEGTIVLPAPSAGGMVLIDEASRLVLAAAPGMRVDAVLGEDIVHMVQASIEYPILQDDAEALVRTIVGRENAESVEEVAFADMESFLDSPSFAAKASYVVKSPVWNTPKPVNDEWENDCTDIIYNLLAARGVLEGAVEEAWMAWMGSYGFHMRDSDGNEHWKDSEPPPLPIGSVH